MKHCLVALLASVFAFSAVTAEAQQKPMRIRGTITAFDGAMLSVKSRDGRDLMIELGCVVPTVCSPVRTKRVTKPLRNRSKATAKCGESRVRRPFGP